MHSSRPLALKEPVALEPLLFEVKRSLYAATDLLESKYSGAEERSWAWKRNIKIRQG